MKSKHMLKKLLSFFGTFSFFLMLGIKVQASCSGTPDACSSIGQGSCSTCGCSWTAAYCNNSGACTGNADQTNCTNCSCAACSWGGTSCPWVAAWNGEDWVIEHEAFPFAAFSAVETTSFDALPNLQCLDGSLKVKIYEGLPEITYLKNFSLYQVNGQTGLVKPDLDGIPRIIQEETPPTFCLSSDEKNVEECLALVSEHDELFWEPSFDSQKTEDWLELEFSEVKVKSSKLYLVVRKQALLTSYYEYMAHMMGRDNFYLFSELSTKPVFKNRIDDWWDENLKMKVEVWDGQDWQEKGLISAGYHMPGSGADDFLVSMEKLDFNSNSLKVRLRFLTGGFGIDYAVLDTTDDQSFNSQQLSPKEILFNDQSLEALSPIEMKYDDSLILTYDCEPNSQYYLAIEGYYLPDFFPAERKKSNISAWQELIRFFTSDKDYVVKTAQKMGLYKRAACLEAFSADEIRAQQAECWIFYLLYLLLITSLIIFFMIFSKKIKKNQKIYLLFLCLSLASMSWRIIAVKATQSCSGTLNCGNCTEAACNTCTQCTWVAANCSGTADSCDSHNNQSDCESCGCTWQYTGLFVDIVDDADNLVSSPAVNFSSTSFPFNATQTVGTLGVGVQRIRVYNDTSTSNWTLSLAATGGESSEWSSGTDSYKYNGLQSEGRLRVNPSLLTITPSGSGCTSTGLTAQSAQYFENGVISSIDLVIAGSSAETSCSWYIEGIGLTQDIPARQATGSYSLAMTITVI